MKPFFRLEANGTDITEKIRDRFVSLTFVDNAGIQNDRLTIELDDRPPHIALAALSTKLKLWLGYLPDPDSEKNYQSMVYIGVFTVDEIQIARDPTRRISVTARTNDTGGTLKRIKTRSWENITIADMIGQIAKEHELTPRIEQTIGSKIIQHIEQSNQSDQGFLTRLAVTNDAVFKIVDDLLFFSPKSNDLSVSGKPIPVTQIDESDLTTWTVLTQQRSNHSDVTARYYDKDEAKEKTVSANTGEDVAETSEPVNANTEAQVPEVAQDKTEAVAMASAHKKALEREKQTLQFSAVGDPRLRAETKMAIGNLRQGVNSLWLINTVTHSLMGGGYTVSGTCETPSD